MQIIVTTIVIINSALYMQNKISHSELLNIFIFDIKYLFETKI